MVGIGNPLRSDDGAGPFLAQKIAESNLAGVQVRILHQLHLELLEEAIKYAIVLLVDASYVGVGLNFIKVAPIVQEHGASSHHLTPEFFCMLAHKLYHRDLILYLCAVPGRNFDFGESFSPDVQALLPEALAAIDSFLQEKLQDA